MNKKTRKYLFLFLRLALSAVAIMIVLRKIDLHQVGEYFSSADYRWLFLAFMVFFFSKAVSAVRLNSFYRQHNLILTQKKNLFLYLLGMFYNLFVPIIGGDGYKVYWLNKNYGAQVKSLIWSSLHDRGSGLVALTFLAAVLAPFISWESDLKYYVPLLIPVMYVAYYFFVRIFFREYLSVFSRINFLSLIVQSTQLLCSYLILLALGVDASMTDYLFIFLLSCYAYIIPVIGAREMAFIFGAEALGLDKELSVSISLFFYFALAFTSLTGMFFLLFPSFLKVKTESIN